MMGYEPLVDAYWGDKKHDGKRGRGASEKTLFVAAVSTNSHGHPLVIRFRQISSFSKNAISFWARKHLDPTCVVVSDGLGWFSAIKECGHEHTAIITGGGPDSVKIPEFKWVNTIIGNVKNAFHGSFHAVSKKHFSRYLGEFFYRFNRRYNLPSMISRFGYIAARTQPMPQRLLKVAEFHR